jgi:predicted glycoside hydrolase/deacetylase ChbG (UPF0249 family)
MNARTAIVQCDDFGIAPSVTSGILSALEAGAATGTSVLANLASEAELAQLARAAPRAAGVHLNLTLGAPLSNPGELAPLLGSGGKFVALGRVLRVCLGGRAPLAAIEREWESQIGRVRDQRLEIASLDSHQHVHWLRPLAEICARLARRFSVPRVRAPKQVLGMPFQLRSLARQLLARAARAALVAEGASSPAALLDLEICERRARPMQSLVAALARVPGSLEVCAHPGTEPVDDDAAVFGLYDRPRQLSWLLAGEVRRALETGGFSLE